MNQIKKYKTKPIDYTGCHPVIADHLMRGLAIECWCWNDDHEAEGSKDFVVYYDFGEAFKYGIFDDDYMNAEPIQVKTVMRKKKASEVAKWLEDNGYKFDGEVWVNQELAISIHNSNIFLNCGELVDKPLRFAPQEWYEEVEV